MSKKRKPLPSMTDPETVHCMFDLETLGSADDTPIVQIGAVLFNPCAVRPTDVDVIACEGGVMTGPGADFRLEIAVDDLSAADFRTLQWWFAQGQEAQQAVFGRELARAPLRDALCRFGGWSTTWGKDVDFWWSDMDFDLRLMRAAWARSVEGYWKCPFGSDNGPHRGVRDVRTIKAIGRDLGIAEPEPWGIEHDALADAQQQARLVSRILNGVAVIK